MTTVSPSSGSRLKKIADSSRNVMRRKSESLTELKEFLSGLPCASVSPIEVGSELLDDTIISSTEAEIDKVKEENRRKRKHVKMQIRPHLLYRSLDAQATMLPDPSSTYQLFDRVINVRESYTVPLGLRGTVTAICRAKKDLDIVYEVVFDEPFASGLSLRCSKSLVPQCSISNVTTDLLLGELDSNNSSSSLCHPEQQPTLHRQKGDATELNATQGQASQIQQTVQCDKVQVARQSVMKMFRADILLRHIPAKNQSNRKFDDSIRQSREFYSAESATIQDMCDATASPLTRAIESAICRGDIPGSIMGIHRGVYWPRMMLEDCHCGCPNAETALAPLRALLYRIVYAVPDHSLLTFDRIQREKIFPNLQTFARIMSYHEPDFPHKFMNLYGRRSGFTYLVLRFFLCMNTGVNLYVGLYEFLALVAMVVGRVDKEWYQSLPLSPSVRCVTLASWFQAVYRHAYYYFGKLLYLSHEFPAPKDIFSGAVWTAFYLAYTQEGQQYCHIHIREETQRIRDDIDRILDDKKHIIPKLVDGIFNYR
ncbi:5'-3' exoribonuclease 1 [Lamellibrachia satsuma]|nr:5'-3' exoribonuclease 1 [Lamellibrachia satsuma]